MIKGQSKECIEHFSHYDTTTCRGNYVLYNVFNDSVTIDYGNKLFRRSLPEKVDCQIADAWIPHYQWDNNDFIVLRYGCGNPCWGILVLPLDSTQNARNIMYEIAFSPKDNLIAYFGYENYDHLIVENLKTCQWVDIELPFKSDHGEFLGYWIEKISIKNKTLYYKYSNPNLDQDKRLSGEVTTHINL
jgi:hypothetical protein